MGRLGQVWSRNCDYVGLPPPTTLTTAMKPLRAGRPSDPGPYVIRSKCLPAGSLCRTDILRIASTRSCPGVFYIGLGDQFDGDTMQAYPPGSVIVLPGNTSQFHWAKSGEYVTQVTAIGPLGLEYLEPGDDPRHSEHAVSSAN
jgi:hypothetical protein